MSLISISFRIYTLKIGSNNSTTLDKNALMFSLSLSTLLSREMLSMFSYTNDTSMGVACILVNVEHKLNFNSSWHIRKLTANNTLSFDIEFIRCRLMYERMLLIRLVCQFLFGRPLCVLQQIEAFNSIYIFHPLDLHEFIFENLQ